MSITEDFSPVYVADYGAILAPQFTYADGTFVPLTGATISLKMQDIDYGTIKTCSGTWTIDDATNGKAHYQYQAPDLDTAGMWKLFVTITIGGKPVHADERLLQIKPAP